MRAGYNETMTDKKNKALLVWPPILTSNVLPLSIPCLAAYLRNNGVETIEVLDMNFAYLKKMGHYWFLYKLFKRGCSVLKRTGSASFGLMSKKTYEVLGLMEAAGKKNIPWSLNAILATFAADHYGQERKKIRSILGPQLSGNGLSFICISANYPEQLLFALLIAREAKGRLGDKIKIVIGGAQVTKQIDYLRASKEVYGFVDFFIVKDGEKPLLELLKDPSAENLSRIPNLYFQDAGAYRRSDTDFFLHPDDFLAPDFSDFDLENYDEVFPVMISKGCPWSQCTFCSYSGFHERKFHLGSTAKALQIIKKLKMIYGASDFCFMDDALPAKFMKELAQELIRDNTGVRWSTSILISKEFADRDLCRLLKTSGFDSVYTGLESVSCRVLNLMHKFHQNLSEADIKNIFTTLKSEGIRVVLNIIFGFPTETLAEARQTLDFLIENMELFDFVRMQPFCLEDQTSLSQEPERFGITKIHREDKNVGRRLGFAYEVREGMGQKEAIRFTYEEAHKLLAQAAGRKAHA